MHNISVLLLLTAIGLLFYYPSFQVNFSVEDLTLYIGNLALFNEDFIPQCFWGNSFAILPGEFELAKDEVGQYHIGGCYRPLITLVFALNYWFSGLNVLSYHLTNLLFLIIISFLLFRLGLAIQLSQESSLVAALIFAAHPIHASQMVAILQGGDLLCTLFSIACLISFIKYRESQKRYLLTGCFIFMSLAYASKEMAASLPFILLAYEVIILAIPDKGIFRSKNSFYTISSHKLYSLDFPINFRLLWRQFRIHLLFFTILGLYFSFRVAIFGGLGGYPIFHGTHITPNSSHSLLGFFIFKNMFYALRHLFAIPQNIAFDKFFYGFFLFSILLVIFLIRKLPRSFWFFSAWVFLGMLPVSSLGISPWYLTLSLVGFAASSSIILNLFVKTRYLRVPIVVLVLIIFLLLNGKILNQAIKHGAYADDFATLLQEKYPTLPKGARIYVLAEGIYETEGQVDFNPSLELLLRIAYKDPKIFCGSIPRLGEVPVIEAAYQIINTDMHQISVDEKTYIFEFRQKPPKELIEREDLRQIFIEKAELDKTAQEQGKIKVWDFQKEADFSEWWLDLGAAKEKISNLSNLTPEGLQISSNNQNSFTLISPPLNIQALAVNTVRIKINNLSKIALQGQVSWNSTAEPEFDLAKSRTFTVPAKEGFSEVIVDVGADYSWVTGDEITTLKINLKALDKLNSKSPIEVIIQTVNLDARWLIQP